MSGHLDASSDAWTSEELGRLTTEEELDIASCRDDGSQRPFVTIWFVLAGDDVYVRSAYGPQNGWYRRARAASRGRIRVGGLERDVAFQDADASMIEPLHQAFRAKYGRYDRAIVDTVLSDDAAAATLRVRPRSA